MTVIVGLQHEGTVYMGGDALACSGSGDAITLATSKVFRKGDLLLGTTGDFRAAQLLRYALALPYHKHDEEITEYLVVELAAAVRDCFAEHQYPRKKEDDPDLGFLIGYKGRLFCMHPDWSVIELASGYYAIGSGDNAALGAFFATDGQEPEQRVQIALEAAAAFTTTVRGPFRIEVLEAE